MDYLAGAAALMGLCLSSILVLATLHWMVARHHTRLTIAWLFAAAALVLLQSLEYLYHATGWYIQYPAFIKIVDPWVVLLPLCLFGYIRALQGENLFANWQQRCWHLSPALLVALLDVPYWSLPAAEKVFWMQQVLIDESRWQPLAPFGNYYLGIIASLSLSYWFRQRQCSAQQQDPVLARWISQLQQLQLIMALSLFGRIVFSQLSGLYPSVVYALAPGTGYLLYCVLVRAQLPLSQASDNTLKPNRPEMSEAPSATKANSEPAQASVAPVIDKSAASTPSLDESEQRTHYQRLRQVLADGAYQDNQLSLSSLAQRCSLTNHQASAAINQCHGNNFYDLLNEFRIHAAKELLRQSEHSISHICYAVGFNSKSTFNTAFRRLTGCTPSQYRQRQHDLH